MGGLNETEVGLHRVGIHCWMMVWGKGWNGGRGRGVGGKEGKEELKAEKRVEEEELGDRREREKKRECV